MKFNLTEYQAQAADDLTAEILDGFRRFDELAKRQAVSLSAPTGAGKTVIATAVIETLWFGSDLFAPNRDVTVLWVTDDPSLNQQTQRKMLVASSQIKLAQLAIVDQSFDQPTFDRGRVYFVHIQQLGKGATNYVTRGNNRKHTLWETIATTISERGHEFVLIVDEAHKGTGSKKAGGKTITAQLMDGADGKLPPTPVVVGISATPQRFVNAITESGERGLNVVNVNPDDVRESGLLKDKLAIKHPAETQPADSTLIDLAVKDLRTFHDLWAEYAKKGDEPVVEPVLVVQLKPNVPDAEVRTLLDTLRSAWPALDGTAIAHSLESHATWNLGNRSVRYVAPQDIQDDARLVVVLFKEALTTGWDCPRAEVMLSLRTAKDHTYIAQLIGRMVRTPLARRVSGGSDVLNTVALFLPYFDDKGVNTVVAGLSAEDTQIASDIELQSVICARNRTLPDDLWNLLADLPTYTRPAKYHRNDVARLNALATLMATCGVLGDAPDVAKAFLVDTLEQEAKRLKEKVDTTYKDLEMLDYSTRTVEIGTREATAAAARVPLNASNIDDLFRLANRTLGDAAAKWYWNTICEGGTDPDEAKLRVAALATQDGVPGRLEMAAAWLVDSWRNSHNGAIAKLPDAKLTQFYTIWQQAKSPQQITMLMPTEITAPAQRIDGDGDDARIVNLDRYEKHIYANGKGAFPTRFQSSWEQDVVAAELALDSIVGWYRNPVGGRAAVAVPYSQSGEARTLYPDLLFFHNTDDGLAVDIIDPHDPSMSDTGPKWTGLAEYAAMHGAQVRRLLAVIKEGERLRSLDLRNPAVLGSLKQASNQTDILAHSVAMPASASECRDTS